MPQKASPAKTRSQFFALHLHRVYVHDQGEERDDVPLELAAIAQDGPRLRSEIGWHIIFSFLLRKMDH